MSNFDPDAYLANKKAFDPDSYLARVKGQPESTSALEATGRGVLQGASLGFQDELTGGISAAASTLFGQDKLKDFTSTYARERDIERAANKKASEDQPLAYGAGNIAGGVGSLFIPGLNLTRVGASALKGLSTAKSITYGAKVGAVQGLGSSEAKDLKGMAQDTFFGAFVGGAVPTALAAIPGTSKAFSHSNKLFAKGVEKFGAGKESAKKIPGYIAAQKSLARQIDDTADAGFELAKDTDKLASIFKTTPDKLQSAMGKSATTGKRAQERLRELSAPGSVARPEKSTENFLQSVGIGKLGMGSLAIQAIGPVPAALGAIGYGAVKNTLDNPAGYIDLVNKIQNSRLAEPIKQSLIRALPQLLSRDNPEGK